MLRDDMREVAEEVATNDGGRNFMFFGSGENERGGSMVMRW
jgi:hypothetical protein